jgi:mono/diheme cytochrome c family protein
MKHLIPLAVMLFSCAHTPSEPAQPPEDVADAGHGSGDIPGVVLPTDPETIAVGAALFGKHCSACHIQGNAYAPGPDLTDDRWSHGYSPNAV